MKSFLSRSKIRHPFFPDLAAVPAVDARRPSTAVAGTFGELARAAGRGVQARRAVYVLTSAAEFLSDGQRDELWRLFQVPVYALLVKHGGRVVAWECEAQNGLHVAEGGDESSCACGRPGLFRGQATQPRNSRLCSPSPNKLAAGGIDLAGAGLVLHFGAFVINTLADGPAHIDLVFGRANAGKLPDLARGRFGQP